MSKTSADRTTQNGNTTCKPDFKFEHVCGYQEWKRDVDEKAVVVQDVDERQFVSLSHLIIIMVMSRSDFHRTCKTTLQFNTHILIYKYGNRSRSGLNSSDYYRFQSSYPQSHQTPPASFCHRTDEQPSCLWDAGQDRVQGSSQFTFTSYTETTKAFRKEGLASPDIWNHWGGQPQLCLQAWSQYVWWPPQPPHLKESIISFIINYAEFMQIRFWIFLLLTWSFDFVGERHQHSKLDLLLITRHREKSPACQLLFIHLEHETAYKAQEVTSETISES